MSGILRLSGKDLEKELARIIRENPPLFHCWTPKEDAVLARLYKAGVPTAKVAEVLELRKTQVDRKISALGLKRRGKATAAQA